MTSYIQRVTKSDDNRAMIIDAIDNEGRACWFKILPYSHKTPLLKGLVKQPHTDLTAYGNVIDSGWGEFVVAQ